MIFKRCVALPVERADQTRLCRIGNSNRDARPFSAVQFFSVFGYHPARALSLRKSYGAISKPLWIYVREGQLAEGEEKSWIIR